MEYNPNQPGGIMAKKSIKEQIEHHDKMTADFIVKAEQAQARADSFNAKARAHKDQATYIRKQVSEAI